ncbi:MAG: RNA 2',3'-cyclic phosphodiesterase [Phycisphaerae bacterium]|nr:RNA 2',3'-cyclic phosphodiesterase [Phycisphaerae bacterium]
MRLFVAAYPPPSFAAELQALLGRVELPDHRPTPADQVHLTLFFVGERQPRELDDVVDTVAAACRGISSFRLRPVLLTALPARGPKRTVVVECDRPAPLVELHRRLVHRLAREPRVHSERDFLPHCTIARFPGAGADCTLAEPLQLGDFEVGAVCVMSSDLAPTGATHRERARVELGA